MARRLRLHYDEFLHWGIGVMTGLLAQGLELLVYGMGTVVVFLAVLVYAMRLMSWFVGRYLPDPELPAQAAGSRPAPVVSAGPSAQQLAAITVAVHRYRQQRRRA